MLLVDDDEPEVLELDARLQQPVRADDDVDLARGEAVERRLGLRAGAEARQQLDLDRPVREPVDEGLVVLLRQQRRRHEHRDLLAALHGDERGAQRDLGLAEADVAADDAVHRAARAQVVDDGLDRAELVDRLLEREARLECAQLLFVDRERMALARRAPRVDVEQFGGRVTDPGRGPGARLGPLVAAELVQRRRFGRRAGVPADALERLHRHVELVAAGVLEHEELGRRAAGVHRREAGVAADAVILVHDRRAGTQVGELLDDLRRVAVGAPAPTLLPRALAEELLLGVDRDGRFAQRDAGGDRRHRDDDRRVGGRGIPTSSRRPSGPRRTAAAARAATRAGPPIRLPAARVPAPLRSWSANACSVSS